jgi:hypothetical protein
MGKLSTKSASHVWLINFVEWIVPEDATEEKIKTQAGDIRTRIEAKAKADGLTVCSMPWSGSFAKKTGLRRHKRGDHEVEGQDVDLPFVVSPATKDGEAISSLLDRFERYARASYPSTECAQTKSSVRLDFKASKLSYDLVPMLAVPGNDEAQVLLRADGERRSTSVQKHSSFIKKRSAISNEQAGRVKFNEGVRLVKWWREMRQSKSEVVSFVPTIVIDLLCAKAFDELGVAETYTETLNRWFGKMAHLVRQRKRVDFKDFGVAMTYSGNDPWVVLDPVNGENNVVPKAWGNLEREEIAGWFEDARDGMARVIAADTSGEESKARDELVEIFGSAVKDHGVSA